MYEKQILKANHHLLDPNPCTVLKTDTDPNDDLNQSDTGSDLLPDSCRSDPDWKHCFQISKTVKRKVNLT